MNLPSPPATKHADLYGGHRVLDPDVIESLYYLTGEASTELVEELVTLFLDDAAKRMKKLTDAYGAGDFEAVTFAAHSLKSASASIGAISFSESCRTLEGEAKRNADNLAKEVSRCEDMFKELVTTLAEFKRAFAG